MLTFGQLLEAMEKSRASPLMDSGEEGEILNVVRTGKDFRKEDETPFWDDFVNLCSNARGLAELLEINPEKIRSWPAKIREALDKLQKHDAESPSESPETTVVPTDANGAVTVNQDPYLGEM